MSFQVTREDEKTKYMYIEELLKFHIDSIIFKFFIHIMEKLDGVWTQFNVINSHAFEGLFWWILNCILEKFSGQFKIKIVDGWLKRQVLTLKLNDGGKLFSTIENIIKRFYNHEKDFYDARVNIRRLNALSLM